MAKKKSAGCAEIAIEVAIGLVGAIAVMALILYFLNNWLPGDSPGYSYISTPVASTVTANDVRGP